MSDNFYFKRKFFPSSKELLVTKLAVGNYPYVLFVMRTKVLRNFSQLSSFCYILPRFLQQKPYAF